MKTYGSELVERLGARTQDVSESMRSYVDNFDNRVTAKANEVTDRARSAPDPFPGGARQPLADR